jgi:hypothetical protein
MKGEVFKMYDSREDTKKHIEKVGEYIQELGREVLSRKITHDRTKLIEPEKPIFDEYTPKLKDSTYGSDEYKGYLKEMNTALQHHYKFNRHHPEHFENGIQGMTLVDLCEMLADWKAATLRHADGDILKSLEINQKRFGYSDELKQILFNTVKEHFE